MVILLWSFCLLGTSTSVSIYFQDAKKGVLFLDFPPVLQLQLKRFEYDYIRDTMVKVGTTLTLSPFTRQIFQYLFLRETIFVRIDLFEADTVQIIVIHNMLVCIWIWYGCLCIRLMKHITWFRFEILFHDLLQSTEFCYGFTCLPTSWNLI
jgi:hypothetical protein